jgi:hypothetical protein
MRNVMARRWRRKLQSFRKKEIAKGMNQSRESKVGFVTDSIALFFFLLGLRVKFASSKQLSINT